MVKRHLINVVIDLILFVKWLILSVFFIFFII